MFRWMIATGFVLVLASGGLLLALADEGDDRWPCPPQTFCEGGGDVE